MVKALLQAYMHNVYSGKAAKSQDLDIEEEKTPDQHMVLE